LNLDKPTTFLLLLAVVNIMIMKSGLGLNTINILLADDDTDDCLFFQKALEEILISNHLTIVHDGEELMDWFAAHPQQLPDVLFLDLNMPRKTGFECLTEIMENEKLKNIYVVMLTTSFPRDNEYELHLKNMLYGLGAHEYIRKPNDFAKLKEIIHNVLFKMIRKNNL
jgi:CheY-like chemotaxis protein